jgi:hypothetical protein
MEGKWTDEQIGDIEMFMFIFYGWVLLPVRIVTIIVNLTSKE